jgi:predicted RNA-binding protein YlqC (UPF0109 family)
MKDFIEYIARSLVEDPTQVSVTEEERGNNVNLGLQVAQSDMGRVIGKQGRVANAHRISDPHLTACSSRPRGETRQSGCD